MEEAQAVLRRRSEHSTDRQVLARRLLDRFDVGLRQVLAVEVIGPVPGSRRWALIARPRGPVTPKMED